MNLVIPDNESTVLYNDLDGAIPSVDKMEERALSNPNFFYVLARQKGSETIVGIGTLDKISSKRGRLTCMAVSKCYDSDYAELLTTDCNNKPGNIIELTVSGPHKSSESPSVFNHAPIWLDNARLNIRQFMYHALTQAAFSLWNFSLAVDISAELKLQPNRMVTKGYIENVEAHRGLDFQLFYTQKLMFTMWDPDSETVRYVVARESNECRTSVNEFNRAGTNVKFVKYSEASKRLLNGYSEQFTKLFSTSAGRDRCVGGCLIVDGNRGNHVSGFCVFSANIIKAPACRENNSDPNLKVLLQNGVTGNRTSTLNELQLCRGSPAAPKTVSKNNICNAGMKLAMPEDIQKPSQSAASNLKCPSAPAPGQLQNGSLTYVPSINNTQLTKEGAERNHPPPCAKTSIRPASSPTSRDRNAKVICIHTESPEGEEPDHALALIKATLSLYNLASLEIDAKRDSVIEKQLRRESSQNDAAFRMVSVARCYHTVSPNKRSGRA